MALRRRPAAVKQCCFDKGMSRWFTPPIPYITAKCRTDNWVDLGTTPVRPESFRLSLDKGT